MNWTRDHTYQRKKIAGIGEVESWCEVLEISNDLVKFCWTYTFASDGVVIRSESTIRFRSKEGIEDSLNECGLEVRKLEMLRTAQIRNLSLSLPSHQDFD